MPAPLATVEGPIVPAVHPSRRRNWRLRYRRPGGGCGHRPRIGQLRQVPAPRGSTGGNALASGSSLVTVAAVLFIFVAAVVLVLV
ncbi:MAG: hypothetical protein AVDCRST_MAG59-1446 [uncultured Thermomicrobiales bacterium]|uniref:Uncharacterized protein n=1 Tax=uncultured Thermomicrobiales bacterium TaxID=1645740 RepID=A0A6J4UE01_9BACT|nr:MAG: hypothetical protein AVDCRST_MAG59-1446 [uncultured Thermomicrobiales bacterium]